MGSQFPWGSAKGTAGHCYVQDNVNIRCIQYSSSFLRATLPILPVSLLHCHVTLLCGHHVPHVSSSSSSLAAGGKRGKSKEQKELHLETQPATLQHLLVLGATLAGFGQCAKTIQPGPRRWARKTPSVFRCKIYWSIFCVDWHDRVLEWCRNRRRPSRFLARGMPDKWIQRVAQFLDWFHISKDRKWMLALSNNLSTL